VTLFIPCFKMQARDSIQENQGGIPRGNGETILLVEDEPAVRKLVSKVLEDLGYAVTVARDGDHALTVLEGIESLDLLLSDVVLPGSLSGQDLATTVERQRPQTQILLMSGYASDILNENGGSDPNPELLHKPFRKAEVARRVRSALDSRGSQTGRVKQTPTPNSRLGKFSSS